MIDIESKPKFSTNEWAYEGKSERIGLNILELLGLLNN